MDLLNLTLKLSQRRPQRYYNTFNLNSKINFKLVRSQQWKHQMCEILNKQIPTENVLQTSLHSKQEGEASKLEVRTLN